MFSSDVESLLNEYYKEKNYKLIGVGNSSLEYDNVNVSGAYTLKQLTRNYLPAEHLIPIPHNYVKKIKMI